MEYNRPKKTSSLKKMEDIVMATASYMVEDFSLSNKTEKGHRVCPLYWVSEILGRVE